MQLSRRAQALSAFQSAPFRLLWFNTLGFTLIQSTQRFAYVWLVLDLGGGPSAAGLVAFALGIPVLVFAIPAGVLSDRADRRVLLIASQAGALAVTVLTAVLIFAGAMNVLIAVLLAGGLGATTAFGQPVRSAIVPSLVPPAGLMNAIVLMTTAMNVSLIIGPALGGAVIAVWGLGGAFMAQAAIYALGALPLVPIRLPPPAEPSPVSRRRQVREGFSFAMHHPGIRVLMLLLVASGLFMMAPFQALLPQIARVRLGAGAFSASMLFTALGVGTLTASVLLASLRSLHHKGLWFNGMLVFGGVGLTLIALSRWYAVTFVLMFLWGIGGGFFMNLNQTLIQSNTPPPLMGRVMSLHTLAFMGASPVGGLLAGAGGRALGPAAWTAWAGVLLAAAAVAALVSQPALRRMD